MSDNALGRSVTRVRSDALGRQRVDVAMFTSAL
ncbi:FxSxx-COOH protein [Streptomyces sp. CME 23]|nr:FxSxx-COOH protein [Streptomyces sp. CME 23]